MNWLIRLIYLGIMKTRIDNNCWSSLTPARVQHQWQTSCPRLSVINTLRPRQNGRHFSDDILKCIFLNENIWISITMSLNFVPKGPINNIPALVQIMAWRRPGDKLLSEPMMVVLLTHTRVARPQWNFQSDRKIQTWISQHQESFFGSRQFIAYVHEKKKQKTKTHT